MSERERDRSEPFGRQTVFTLYDDEERKGLAYEKASVMHDVPDAVLSGGYR